MKRKSSVGMVLVILLILAAVTALAVASLRDTAKFLAQTQQEEGYFGAWPVEKKVELILALAEQGYVQKDAQMRRMMEGELTGEEAGRAADAAVAALTGQDAAYTGFLDIMTALWGPFGQWDHEQKAWYSQLMEDVGIQSDGKTFFVQPEGPIGQEDAIGIARRAIAQGYSVQEGTLDGYTLAVTFQVPESAEPGDTQPYWAVAYTAPDSLDKAERLFNHLEVFVHPSTGTLLRSVEDMLATKKDLPTRPSNELYQAIDAYYERALEEGCYAFRSWPLTLRAEYSQEITPKVKALVEKNDLAELMNSGNLDITVLAHSTYLYGMPGSQDIPQEQALALAQAALRQTYHLDAELFSLYLNVNVYFDVTNPEQPLWKFFFNPKELPWQGPKKETDNPLPNLCYKAEVDARTGETIRVDAFAFQDLGQELEYDVKWY